MDNGARAKTQKEWQNTSAIMLLFALGILSLPVLDAAFDRFRYTAVHINTLIATLVWPLTTLVAFVLFRGALAELVSQIGRRATKIGAFNVEVEFAAAPPSPSQDRLALEQVRDPIAADRFPDSSSSLFADVAGGTPADYAVVDLGEGKNWLTSRLFILAAMMPQARGIRSIVFVKSSAGVADRLLGVAAATDVQGRLAARYPWMEMAFLEAMKEHGFPPKSKPSTVPYTWLREPDGAVRPDFLVTALRGYVDRIQRKAKPNEKQMNLEEWTPLKRGLYERATWIDDSLLEQLLGSSLKDHTVWHAPEWDEERQAREALRSGAPFIAIVDKDHRFRGLLQRDHITEAIAASYLKQGA